MSYLFWEQASETEERGEPTLRLMKGADTFNVDISNWDVSRVTSMKGAFSGAKSFNQPIGDWNTHRVVDMSSMFEDASTFNRDVSKFSTRNVRDMSSMFRRASRFHNPDLTNWDVSRVTDMSSVGIHC